MAGVNFIHWRFEAVKFFISHRYKDDRKKVFRVIFCMTANEASAEEGNLILIFEGQVQKEYYRNWTVLMSFKELL